MEPLDALITANREFESRLREVKPEHMALPTPCPDWDVRTLVNHMLLGTRMSVQLLDGMARDEVIAGLGDDLMSDDADPVATFVDLANQMVEGFSGPDGLEGMVAHPAGDFPRSVFIGFRITDGAVHAWDLATGIGADTTLNEDLAQFMWENGEPQRDMLVASGMFGEGPSDTLGDDASAQSRILDLLGRRP
jgi:uncharacterized protein (TIGR03086 family)